MDYKQEVKYRQDHDDFFQEIKPALEIYEGKRKKYRRNHFFLRIAALLATIGVTYALWVYGNMEIDGFLPVIFFTGALLFGISGYFKRRYIAQYKRDILSIMFEREGILIEHKANRRIDSNHFNMSSLFLQSNRFKGDDLIKGHKDDLFFICSELKAGYQRDSDSPYKAAFEGIFLVADLPTKPKGETTIYCKNYVYKQPYREVPDNQFNSLSSQFESLFNVEYSDYEDASHVIMPAFMKALIEFREKHRMPFILRIKHGKVYLAINENKDFFKVLFSDQAQEAKNVMILARDANFFFDVVHLLGSVK